MQQSMRTSGGTAELKGQSGPSKVDGIQFKAEKRDDAVVITIGSRNLLDVANCSVFTTSVLDLAQGTKKVVIHFGSADTMSSYMLGDLYKINAQLVSRGISLALCCFDPRILEVLKITCADRTLKVYDTLDKALQGAPTT